MSTKAPPQTRLAFVDTLRGLAVLFMIPLHTAHGWVRVGDRAGNAWSAIQFFGGLAAPLFLTLAGASLGLRWAQDEARGRTPRHRRDLARALQIVVLGYALRLQMWIVDGAAFSHAATYPAQLLLLGGYGLAYGALHLLPTRPQRALAGVAVALGMIGFGFSEVAVHAPARVPGLSRVDVLQCIGVSLALATLIGAARGRAFGRAGLYVALAAGAACLASWTRSWVPGPLPPALAAYLGQWKPVAHQGVISLFPLFPWFAYACAGLALGLAWARAEASARTARLVVALTAAGACIALATSESLPHVFQPFALYPGLVQPVRVLYRLGVVLVLAGAAFALASAPARVRSPLDLLGRASLLVYWVHLEFAFGALSHPVTKRLDLEAWAIGTVGLICAMVLLAYLRFAAPHMATRAIRATGVT